MTSNLEYFGVFVTEPGEKCPFCDMVNDKSRAFTDHINVHKEKFDEPDCGHPIEEMERRMWEGPQVIWLYLKCHCGNEKLKWKPK